MSGLQNGMSSKRPFAKNIHIYSELVVVGNPQVLLQPCFHAQWWLCFILYFRGFLPFITIIASSKYKWHTLYFKSECKLGNSYTFCLISISNLKIGRFETIRFETWRFVNLTFCKPDVLKPDVLKPDVLKPDVLKPDVLWVYRQSMPRSCADQIHICQLSCRLHFVTNCSLLSTRIFKSPKSYGGSLSTSCAYGISRIKIRTKMIFLGFLQK